jgi:pimeloyl-ACP methyl ester carboxylesterase
MAEARDGRCTTIPGLEGGAGSLYCPLFFGNRAMSTYASRPMHYLQRMIVVAFFAAMVLHPTPAEAQSRLLWGSLKSGTDAVGFRVQYQLDQSREYDPPFRSELPFPTHHPRPIMIAIWYPAQRSAKPPMRYREYFAVAPATGPLVSFGARVAQATRKIAGEEITGDDAGTMTPVDSTGFARLLETRTMAVRNAAPAPGRHPVLLYHPGLGGSYEDNSVLFEYLASRGFIVISSPFPDPDGSNIVVSGDIPGSFADLSFLTAFARSLPNADADRIGVMGHSYGAWVSFAWAASTDAPVRALITLDSGFEYDSLSAGPELLQLHMKTHRTAIRAATLRVASTERSPHFEYLDPYLAFVPRYGAAITSLKHNDYLTHGAIRPDFFPGKWPDARHDRRASYDRLCELVATFLDATLRGRAGADTLLADMATHSGPDSRLSLRFTPALSPPPTQRQMALLLQQRGAAYTIDLLRAFPAVAQSKMVGGLITLVSDGDFSTALPALRVAEHTYPGNAGIEALLGQVLLQTGDRRGAERAFRQGLALLATDSTMGAFRSYWEGQIQRGLKELGVP